jgi:hypothetical protein
MHIFLLNLSKRKCKMKVFMTILLLLPFGFISAQKIGEMAPDKAPEVFPNNGWGMDIMFGEGGFGLGTFYRRQLSQTLTGFVDFSISETKDEREVTYVDYFGNTYTPNKVYRSFELPLNFGIQYRMFQESLTDNFRPYINIGVGPTFIVTTPYEEEFFASFKWAQVKYAVGGYIGIGSNVGISKTSLVGLNVRYYYCHVFGNGIENLLGDFRKDIGQLAICLNLGIMY